jgi:hypothetical protein
MDNKDLENVRPNLVTLPGRLKPDPVSLAQQAKYKQQGLTVTSNNTSIIPRDSAGNIILQENSETNPLLIIEPVTTKITTNSILRVIETRFQYYKFPASIIPVTAPVEVPDFNIELTTADNDPVFARYKPSENSVISAGGIPSGILMDEIEAGNLQKNTNTYYITKEVKNSGTDLRLRVKIAHDFLTPNLSKYGTAYFTIMRGGPEKPLNRYYRPIQTTNPPPEVYANGRTVPGGDYVFGAIAPGETQNLFIDEIIPNSEFEIGDSFSIGAYAGQNLPDEYHTINSEQTYWVITDASKNVDEWNQEI